MDIQVCEKLDACINRFKKKLLTTKYNIYIQVNLFLYILSKNTIVQMYCYSTQKNNYNGYFLCKVSSLSLSHGPDSLCAGSTIQ